MSFVGVSVIDGSDSVMILSVVEVSGVPVSDVVSDSLDGTVVVSGVSVTSEVIWLLPLVAGVVFVSPGVVLSGVVSSPFVSAGGST